MKRTELRNIFAIQILNGIISSREQWLSMCQDAKGIPQQ